MEQATNLNDDGLPRYRARLTEAVQVLLLSMEEPQQVFQARQMAVISASSSLSLMLLHTVPYVSMELGEAYTAEANSLRDTGFFLTNSVREFRRRKGIADKTDIEKTDI